MLGCILFRKNIKYIWPQLIPAVTSLVSSAVYLAIYYKGNISSIIALSNLLELADALKAPDSTPI